MTTTDTTERICDQTHTRTMPGRQLLGGCRLGADDVAVMSLFALSFLVTLGPVCLEVIERMAE